MDLIYNMAQGEDMVSVKGYNTQHRDQNIF